MFSVTIENILTEKNDEMIYITVERNIIKHVRCVINHQNAIVVYSLHSEPFSTMDLREIVINHAHCWLYAYSNIVVQFNIKHEMKIILSAHIQIILSVMHISFNVNTKLLQALHFNIRPIVWGVCLPWCTFHFMLIIIIFCTH